VSVSIYILRVYRARWRSFSNICYELDVLLHLNQQHIPVSIPLIRTDGRYVHRLRAPEGERFAVLFTYAPGADPSYDGEQERETALHYGQAVAKIHAAMDHFMSSHRRFGLDLEHLIDRPLHAIRPHLLARRRDWRYLQQLGTKLKHYIEALPGSVLDQGFCHGDLHGWNAKVAADKTITFFDFDCCGPGWRAYDLAVFRWNARLREKEDLLWSAFLEGYKGQRQLNAQDEQVIPIFIGIRHIWMLGLHTANGQDWGYGWMNDQYFDRAISFLKAWEKDYFTQAD
jgi:Ser/Thr protein kinase RdoA (MazF antagonist)